MQPLINFVRHSFPEITRVSGKKNLPGTRNAPPVDIIYRRRRRPARFVFSCHRVIKYQFALHSLRKSRNGYLMPCLATPNYKEKTLVWCYRRALKISLRYDLLHYSPSLGLNAHATIKNTYLQEKLIAIVRCIIKTAPRRSNPIKI